MSMVARQIQHQQEDQISTKKRIRVQYEKMKITKGEKLIVAMMTIIAFLTLTFIIHNSATIYSLNHEMHQLESSINTQTQINEGLSLQVVELSAPDRILSIATGKLSMSLNDQQVKVVQN